MRCIVFYDDWVSGTMLRWQRMRCLIYKEDFKKNNNKKQTKNKQKQKTGADVSYDVRVRWRMLAWWGMRRAAYGGWQTNKC